MILELSQSFGVLFFICLLFRLCLEVYTYNINFIIFYFLFFSIAYEFYITYTLLHIHSFAFFVVLRTVIWGIATILPSKYDDDHYELDLVIGSIAWACLALFKLRHYKNDVKVYLYLLLFLETGDLKKPSFNILTYIIISIFFFNIYFKIIFIYLFKLKI